MERLNKTSRMYVVILCVVFSGIVTCIPNESAAAQTSHEATIGKTPLTKAGAAWAGKMQQLYKTLADLLTDVTSDARFRDPGNRHRIDREADQLASLVHDLRSKDLVGADPDPTIPLVADLLARETRRAADELKRGNRIYARGILRTVPSYCIACHTRNSSGVQFSQLPFEPSSATLTPLEKGEFYAASRQYDRAQQQFIHIVQDSSTVSPYNFDWERAVQRSLAIAVRVKKDPIQAQEIIESVLNSKNAPSSLKADARVWKTSIDEWKAEPARQAVTEEGLNAEAIRLIAKAREIQKYPMDRTADIYYLRASAAVHDLLQAAPNGGHVSEALLLGGISYEVLSPLKLEDLHNLYYEACIRRSPHTVTADLCFRRFEESMIFGYTGSGGTDIPEDVRGKLAELRSLSQVSVPTLK